MINIYKSNNINAFFNKKGAIKIITHDGLFHGDEVFAVALMMLFYKELNIVRTRDAAILEKGVKDQSVYVLDVGGDYNPEMKNFDHHQEEVPGGKAAVSLLFESLFPDFNTDRELTLLHDRLIKGINDWDLGLAQRDLTGKPLYLPQLISNFNRFGTDRQDAQFIKAVDFAYVVLSNEMNTAKEIVKAERIWEKKHVLNNNTVLLTEYCAFWRTIQNEEARYKFVVQPEKENWVVSSVDSNKYPLPVVQENKEGLIFQHKQRFLTVFDSFDRALDFVNNRLN